MLLAKFESGICGTFTLNSLHLMVLSTEKSGYLTEFSVGIGPQPKATLLSNGHAALQLRSVL